MEKIKKTKEQIEFINSASYKALADYVLAYPFSPKAENVFVEKATPKLIQFYIEQHGVAEGSAVYLFRQNHPSVVQALLAYSQDGNRRNIKLFLEHGVYETVKRYVDDFEVPELPEQAILERFDREEMLELTRRPKLSSFAKLDIIKRGDDELRHALIATGKFDQRERDAILYGGSKDDVECLISRAEFVQSRAVMKQVALIRFTRPRKLKPIIKQQRFMREAEEFFMATAPIDLLMAYVRHYRPEGGDEAIFNHRDDSLLLTYLSKNQLTEAGEHLLLKRGNHEEIKVYIKGHVLNAEDEVRLIKRGKHNEIMLYLSKHTLSSEAQVELMLRRKMPEIAYYVMMYPDSISEAGEEALKKYATPDIVADYQTVYTFETAVLS